MADLSIKAGATSQSVNLFIQDTRSATGAGLTGLVYNSSGLTAYYSFTGASATAVAITLATLALVTTAYSSGGFKEIDATNMPGWYRLDVPNAALATSSGRVCNLHLQGAANMAPKVYTIELTGWDNQDATAGGLSRLDAAVSSRMATYTQPTGFLAATFPSGTVANTTNITAGTITTVTNLTNAPTSGDLTATMKTSVTTACTAATPTVTTGTISSGALNAAAINADTGFIVRANTAAAVAAGSITLDASATATDNFYNNLWCVITSATTGAGQVRRISGYTGSTQVATVSPNWTTTPTGTVKFALLPAARVDIAAILGTASAGQAGSVGIDWGQVANPSSTVNLSATTTNLVNTLTTYTGNTPQTGDSFARIGSTGSGLTSLAPSSTALSTATWTGTLATNLTTLASHDPGATIGTSTLTQSQVTGGAYALNSASFAFNTAFDFTSTQKTSLNNATPTVTLSGDLTSTMKTSVTTAVNAATTVGITSNRKKGSGATFEFLMQDSTTGAPKTGLTVAATISKDGGAPASTSNSVTEIGLGQYQIVLTATEMTANNIFLQFTSTGAVTSNLSVQTQL